MKKSRQKSTGRSHGQWGFGAAKRPNVVTSKGAKQAGNLRKNGICATFSKSV